MHIMLNYLPLLSNSGEANDFAVVN